jgi:hypothetical protein
MTMSLPAANPLRGATYRMVPVGPERDAYLPLFHLADDSVEQVLGYYQTGILFALDTRDRVPIGIILTVDEADDAVELKAVAVDVSLQNRSVGTGMLLVALEKLLARGVRRVVVGTSSSGSVSSPITRRPGSGRPGSSPTSSTGRAAIPATSMRTASRCATWSGWTSNCPRCRHEHQRRRRALPPRNRDAHRVLEGVRAPGDGGGPGAGARCRRWDLPV